MIKIFDRLHMKCLYAYMHAKQAYKNKLNFMYIKCKLYEKEKACIFASNILILCCVSSVYLFVFFRILFDSLSKIQFLEAFFKY
jgi:hypothetical protein